jgi:hypothetical protein
MVIVWGLFFAAAMRGDVRKKLVAKGDAKVLRHRVLATARDGAVGSRS